MKSSIARKLAMALSALFLMVFLLQHLSINFLSVFSEDLFNEVSHFMGTNPLVQFALQPILIFAVIFHFVMGFILEYRNRQARVQNYEVYKGGASASWMSRNMIYTGLAILGFIALHFYDFWIPEMDYKYFSTNPEDPTRYYEELRHKFVDLWRVLLYVVAFVFLALHLQHGFQSAFQSIGVRGRFTPALQKLSTVYAIAVPLGFIIIALYHYLTH
ncbi:MAG: succinate dehydrogenase cytochrome b subunit [Flavobacteriales bacterium]|nr:succinate dehydrogenase cytochrome b subunit [Flavobacteriales bacterium]